MIIRNSFGEIFDVGEQTFVEIERPNIFFSELGEHSLPMTLPDSSHNRSMLGFADHLAAVGRRNERLQVSIEDGGFFSPAEMALLSWEDGVGFQCSFTLSTATFFDKIREKRLFDIFSEEKHVVKFGGVMAAIDYLEGLSRKRPEIDDAFDVFELRAEYVVLNEIDKNTKQFVKRSSTKMDEVHLPAGFLITPFLRLRYVLRTIFAEFGYTISSWGFLGQRGYKDIVILNAVQDAIVNAKIEPKQLVPDITVGAFLDVLRKKFNVEFVPRSDKSIEIVDRQLSLSAQITIDPYLSSPIQQGYLTSFKHIALSSKNYESPKGVMTGGEKKEIDSSLFEPSESFSAILRHGEGLKLNEMTGTLSRYMFDAGDGYYAPVSSLVGGYSDDSDSSLQTFKIEVNDSVPATEWIALNTDAAERLYLNVGKGQWKNSYVIDKGKRQHENEAKETLLSLAIAESAHDGLRYGYVYRPIDYTSQHEYASLAYMGDRGLYRLRYKEYDHLLRNALREIEVSVRIPRHILLSLDPMRPVSLQGQTCLIKSIKYSTDYREPATLYLLTTRALPPISSARELPDTFSEYGWQIGVIADREFIIHEEDCEYVDTGDDMLKREHWTKLMSKYDPQEIRNEVAALIPRPISAPTKYEIENGFARLIARVGPREPVHPHYHFDNLRLFFYAIPIKDK